MENTSRDNFIIGILVITCGPFVLLYLLPKLLGQIEHQSQIVQDFDRWFVPALHDFIYQTIPWILGTIVVTTLLVACFFWLKLYFCERREDKELFYWRFEQQIEARWKQELKSFQSKQQQDVEVLGNEIKKLRAELERQEVSRFNSQQLGHSVEHLV